MKKKDTEFEFEILILKCLCACELICDNLAMQVGKMLEGAGALSREGRN